MGAATVSVIICAHNPRADYLRRVLAALEAQTLPREMWELLLVDNASADQLARTSDLSWHPDARHIREDKLGVTFARVRGMAKAKGNLLILVDDDNVLAPDYLATARSIASANPQIGAFSGSSVGEYETTPPSWLSGQEWRLAVRNITRDLWSNDPHHWASRPIGAGLCIRSLVTRRYLDAVAAQPKRLMLGSRGAFTFPDEDHDLVEAAADLGLGWGVFERLWLTHLIPSARLTESYFEKLIEGQAASRAYRLALGGDAANIAVPPSFGILHSVYRFLRYGARAARFKRAERRGVEAGLALFNGLTDRAALGFPVVRAS